MMPELSAISAIAPIASGTPGTDAGFRTAQAPATSFGELLSAGLRDMDAKVQRADLLVQAFSEGETVPVHRVTLALEEARLAVEIAVEVRARLVETYRDFMNMQI